MKFYPWVRQRISGFGQPERFGILASFGSIGPQARPDGPGSNSHSTDSVIAAGQAILTVIHPDQDVRFGGEPINCLKV